MMIYRILLISLSFLFCSFLGFSQNSNAVKKRIDKLNKINTIKVAYHPLVVEQIFKFSKRKSFPKTMGLAKFYFPLFKAKLKLYNLPEELKYLTVVESNLKSVATSRVGAQGLWQFMRTTGKQMGLYQNQHVDIFNDPVASTDAACRYLKMLYGQLGNWELALAAYNCGIGRVQKLLRKTKGKTFWDIRAHLPKETQLYVPSFLAVQYLMNYYHNYNLKPYSLSIAFEDVKIIKAKRAISYASLDFKSQRERRIFKFLNPHIKNEYIPTGTYFYMDKNSSVVSNSLVLN